MLLKKLSALVLGLVCLPTYILGLSEEMQELANQLHNSCVEETGTSEDDITNARNGQFTEDTKFKCYVKCLMAQMAVIEDDGSMDPEALIAVLPEDMQAVLKGTIAKCVTEGMKTSDIKLFGSEIMPSVELYDVDEHKVYTLFVSQENFDIINKGGKPDPCAVAWETFKCYYNTDAKNFFLP